MLQSIVVVLARVYHIEQSYNWEDVTWFVIFPILFVQVKQSGYKETKIGQDQVTTVKVLKTGTSCVSEFPFLH